MRNASIQVKRTTASINPEFESCLSGIKTAKAFANEAAELNKFNAANHQYGIFYVYSFCGCDRGWWRFGYEGRIESD